MMALDIFQTLHFPIVLRCNFDQTSENTKMLHSTRHINTFKK